MDHEPTPLSNTKVPKGKPVTKFMNNKSKCSFWQETLIIDQMFTHFLKTWNFYSWSGGPYVNLVVQVWLIVRYVYLAIESGGTNLYILCPNSIIPKTVNNFDNILICLHIVHHESLKVGFNIPMFELYAIEFCSHDLLCFGVFRLHVTNYNGHHFAISWIINMAGHGCPTSDLLHMVNTWSKSFPNRF